MFSILIVSRKKGNGDSKLLDLLTSLWDNSLYKNNFEVLIKFDSDDEEGLKLISEFSKFQFPIKYLIDNRGNGRIDLHLSYNKLLPLANRISSLFTTFADDFLPLPQWDLTIELALKQIIGDIFIIQYTYHPPNTRPDYQTEPFYMGYNLNEIEDIISLEIAPILSRSLLFLCGGWGNVSFTDIWSYYLQRLLWDLYNIKITFFTDKQYVKRVDPQGAWRTSEQVQEKINEDIKNFNFIKSDYFKESVRIQVDNIMRYLRFSNFTRTQR